MKLNDFPARGYTLIQAEFNGDIPQAVLSSGGASSPMWDQVRQVIADLVNAEDATHVRVVMPDENTAIRVSSMISGFCKSMRYRDRGIKIRTRRHMSDQFKNVVFIFKHLESGVRNGQRSE